MDISSLNDLDFSESGEWPVAIKAVAVILLCVIIFAGGYYYLIEPKQVELAQLEKKEAELKTIFEIKQAKAANLEPYTQQMEEMKLTFATMLQQLPKKSDVADLLIDISQTGLVNGLVFNLFKPEQERPVDFYAELPIKMNVTGTYHQFGKFVSDISSLSRIVTLHDFTLTPNNESGNMTMSITAKTYRYFDGEQ